MKLLIFIQIKELIVSTLNRNQKINCTVESCKFNNQKSNNCMLKQITVTPIDNCDTKQPDESMCSSYENMK